MSDGERLEAAVAEKERLLTDLDAELVRLRTGARFNRPHLVLALSLLLVVIAVAARGWLTRTSQQAPRKPACAGR